MCVPNLVPIGPQATTCIPSEGYTHTYTHTHTLSYIDIDTIFDFTTKGITYSRAGGRVSPTQNYIISCTQCIYISIYWRIIITLSPCAVESHPTPDSRGSYSPSRSISGVSSHVADRGSARIPLESVHPSLPWSSSLSRSIHSPEHHVIFHPSCSHHVSKVA